MGKNSKANQQRRKKKGEKRKKSRKPKFGDKDYKLSQEEFNKLMDAGAEIYIDDKGNHRVRAKMIVEYDMNNAPTLEEVLSEGYSPLKDDRAKVTKKED